MATKTILDAYNDFQASNTKVNRSTLRSVIHRFLAQRWGGEAPKGNKATTEEVNILLKLLERLPASLLTGTMEIIEEEFRNKNIVKENSKSYRSAYKIFLRWAEVNNYCIEIKEEDIKIDLPTKIFTRRGRGSRSNATSNYHNQTLKQPYTLMGKHSGSGANVGQLIYPSDYINPTLEKELMLFKKFRLENHNCSKATIDKDIKEIHRILGWLHRYKSIPLEDLRLTSIIYFIKLNISYGEFKDKKGRINYHKYEHEKIVLVQQARYLANDNIKLIEEYANFLNGHPKTKALVITVCVALAKFIFKEEIEINDYSNASDLPIIKKLSNLHTIFKKKANSTPHSVPHSNKSIPWHETFIILEKLRKRVHCLNLEERFTRKTTNGDKEYIYTTPRSQVAIINNLQTFLSLAFMILIPVDRARTYYELELGRTFVCGVHKEGRFTSIDNLEDNADAEWFIHLMPSDYKTGKTYKEYWGKMPNFDFKDGNKLYDYINSWIKEGREYSQKCGHNYFFRHCKDYQPMSSANWGSRIKTIFTQETGIPVTPKELRKMYVTDLNNQGATNAELKGAAYGMHNSPRIQESDYNIQTSLDKTTPINEFDSKTHRKFLGLTPEK